MDLGLDSLDLHRTALDSVFDFPVPKFDLLTYLDHEGYKEARGLLGLLGAPGSITYAHVDHVSSANLCTEGRGDWHKYVPWDEGTRR